MTDNEFKIGEKSFKLRKLDAFKQFHIVRRITPLLTELLPAMKGMKMQNFEKLSEDEKFDQVAMFAGPIMEGLSKLSDADSEFVLYGLLTSAEVQQETGNWARVANGSTLMMQDFDLPLLLQIAGRAFMYNLSGFFGALPRQS